jgi:UDP-GlcNAc3NAcA epimerase
MKFAHIVGNRPQFIKLAMLHDELRKRQPGQSLIVHTGQHFSAGMSDVFFTQLGIPAPDHQLHIHSLSHNQMIGNMLIQIDEILAAERPDRVIVYGDTNSTLAGALAAKKRNIPLAHVEAGIRTGKEDMPEESNRYLTDRMADLNFACTPLGLENLIAEGCRSPYNCGDLMLDAALRFKDEALARSGLLHGLGIEGKPFLLATIHRAENTEDPEALGNIVRALNILHGETPVIFPMHPGTRQVFDQYRMKASFPITAPLGYLDMLALVQTCRSVITDSGGLSREAFFFRKPTLVVMKSPFWPELLLQGPCLQSGAKESDILEKQAALASIGNASYSGLFGEGRAAARIAELLTGEGASFG